MAEGLGFKNKHWIWWFHFFSSLDKWFCLKVSNFLIGSQSAYSRDWLIGQEIRQMSGFTFTPLCSTAFSVETKNPPFQLGFLTLLLFQPSMGTCTQCLAVGKDFSLPSSFVQLEIMFWKSIQSIYKKKFVCFSFNKDFKKCSFLFIVKIFLHFMENHS